MLKNLFIVLTVWMVSGLALASEVDISGVTYYQYSITQDESITNAFEFQRVYFTFQKEVSDRIKYTFQTDIDYNTSPKALYLKNAKVDWKSPFGKIIIGLQGLNMFNVQEKTWGYRSLEKSIMDRKGLSSSADLGLGYSNTLANNISYSVIVSNGAGYKKQEDDSFKKVSGQVSIGEGRLDKNQGVNYGVSASFEPYTSDADTRESKTVFGAFGGFANSSLRMGGEFDLMTNPDNAVNQFKAISCYGNLILSDKLHAYARVDISDNGTNTENYLIAGLAYAPDMGLSIMPNMRYLKSSGADAVVDYLLNFEFKF